MRRQHAQRRRIELDAALKAPMASLLKDDTDFCKQFVQNESFR